MIFRGHFFLNQRTSRLFDTRKFLKSIEPFVGDLRDVSVGHAVEGAEDTGLQYTRAGGHSRRGDFIRGPRTYIQRIHQG